MSHCRKVSEIFWHCQNLIGGKNLSQQPLIGYRWTCQTSDQKTTDFSLGLQESFRIFKICLRWPNRGQNRTVWAGLNPHLWTRQTRYPNILSEKNKHWKSSISRQNTAFVALNNAKVKHACMGSSDQRRLAMTHGKCESMELRFTQVKFAKRNF